jgi:hypothetical protein
VEHTTTISNSIVWGNRTVSDPRATDLYDYSTNGPIGSFTINNSIIGHLAGVYPGSGNLNVDPQFIDTSKANLYLQPTSPAIEAGNNSNYTGNIANDTCLNGAPRLTGATIDIGAYEHGPVLIAEGVPGVCVTYSPVRIDDTNSNTWVPIADSSGNIIAEIKANGNNLGLINYQLYVHNGSVRQDAAGHLYLNRDLVIIPERQPSTPVSIRIYLTRGEFEALRIARNSQDLGSGVNTIDDLAIFKNANGICGSSLQGRALGIFSVGQPYANGYFITADISSFSTFYFSQKSTAALPLNFLEFNGRLSGNLAFIHWKTSNELNTYAFIVERSEDGTNFVSVGKVLALGSIDFNQYSFIDSNAVSAAPSIYYRLKQIVANGKSSYSRVISLNLKNITEVKVSIYPNPVRDHVRVAITVGNEEQNLEWFISDNTGRILRTGILNVRLNSSLSLPVESLSRGVYYFILRCGTLNDRIKFIKQ